MAQSALRNISPTWWKDIKPQAPQKPVGQQMSDVLGGMALATAPIPVVGDVAGAVSDAAMYAAYPEQRTMLNAGMSLAGLLPFVPGAGGVRAAEKAAEDAFDVAADALINWDKAGRPPVEWIDSNARIARDKLKSAFESMDGRDKNVFWRGTNNKGEPKIAHKINSKNHVSGIYEGGFQ
jgi:hypothetical protein